MLYTALIRNRRYQGYAKILFCNTLQIHSAVINYRSRYKQFTVIKLCTCTYTMHLWNIYKHRSWCYEKKMVLMYRYFNCVFTVLMYKLPDSFSSAFVYVDNFVLWINWKSQSRPTLRTVIVWYVWNVAHFDSNGCIVISFNFTLFYKCKSLILFFTFFFKQIAIYLNI